MDEEDEIVIPYPYCYGCGYLREEKGKIPINKYRDADAEEPKDVYVDGYKDCDDPCHPTREKGHVNKNVS